MGVWKQRPEEALIDGSGKPPLVKGARRRRGDLARKSLGPKVCEANFGSSIALRAMEVAAEPADKPGSVVDSHSSGRMVTHTLKQPTRRLCGSHHRLPIWSCSRWGLPCRSVAGLAVRSYRTISPLPASCLTKTLGRTCVRQAFRSDSTAGGIFLLHCPSARAAQALPGTVPCGARTFLDTGCPMPRLSGRLRRRHCTGSHARNLNRCCPAWFPREMRPAAQSCAR